MSIYDTLNPEQKKAVLHTEGPVLILAGAGSGKTRVLTHRVAYLIDECGVNPWNIMAITFTNKAAGEMRTRVDSIVGFGSESIWVTTFHSSCVRILRRYAERIGYGNNFAIYDSDDSRSVMRDICKKYQLETQSLKARRILSTISSLKDKLITADEYSISNSDDYEKAKIAKAYQEYQSTLRKNNAMDFDDLIMKTVELFKKDEEVLDYYRERFRYIMVDEYQDTNDAQFELIRLLADKYRNLCVVGDDDQSIYRFRGANIRNILDFEQIYPEAEVIKLEQNYRSTQNILDAANNVIRNNKGRKAKSLWTDEGSGDRIVFAKFDTPQAEAEYIAGDIARGKSDGTSDYSDDAILYRTNAQSRLLEEQLVLKGIPYNIVGGTNFYSRREVKDLLCYLKTIENGQDDLAVKRIINVPKRGIGATSVNRVQQYADEHGMSFYDALAYADDIVSGTAAAKLKSFDTLIREFRSLEPEYSVENLTRKVIENIDYNTYLKALDDADDDNGSGDNDRAQNVEELISKIMSYEEKEDEPSLGGFLVEVALVADIDNLNSDDNKVLLMTLHSAKGLEFENVYLAGMEEGLFPGNMTLECEDSDPAAMEEERRLAYVGITRAKKHLTLTASGSRVTHGQLEFNPVSRFVGEIPEELLEIKDSRKNAGREKDRYDEDRYYDSDDSFGEGRYSGKSDSFGEGRYSGKSDSFGEGRYSESGFGNRSQGGYGRTDDNYGRPTSGGSYSHRTGFSQSGDFRRSTQAGSGYYTSSSQASHEGGSSIYGLGRRPRAASSLSGRAQPKDKPYIMGASKKHAAAGTTSLDGISRGMPSIGAIDYLEGDRVKHIKYGDGTVRAIEMTPRDYKVTVDFDEAGQKVMFAAFAKLKKLDKG